MNIETAILQFVNLYEQVGVSAFEDHIYEKQEELVNEFRKKKLTFRAKMPMRHRYKCKLCGIEQGESLIHLENPNVAVKYKGKEIMWGIPVGIWVQIKASELHLILTHNEVAPKDLVEVLSSVNIIK